MPEIILDIPNRSVDCIMQELPGKMSRATVIIPAGTGKVPANMVLGQITNTRNCVPFESSLTNGADTAAAVNLYDVDATTEDQYASAIVKVADLDFERLRWATTVDSGEKASAEASLAAKMVRFMRRVEVA